MIKTTVAAITEDGTILPVENESVSGRYDRAMIDIDNNEIITNAYAEGNVYDTTGDTAYNHPGATDVEIRAVSDTIYYVAYPTSATAAVPNVAVRAFVGYSNAPDIDAADIEDVYAVGTRHDVENNLGNAKGYWYTADVVVIEMNKPYVDDAEIVFLVDDDVSINSIDERPVRVIGEDGEEKTVYVDPGASSLALTPVIPSTTRVKFAPGLYEMRKIGTTGSEDLYSLKYMDADDIRDSGKFDAGLVQYIRPNGSRDYLVLQHLDENGDVIAGGYIGDTDPYKIASDKLWRLEYGVETQISYNKEAPDVFEKDDIEGVLGTRVDHVTLRNYEGNREFKIDAGTGDDGWYNYNRVLVRHDGKGNMVYAISFANVIGNGIKNDFAKDVWESVVPSAEDGNAKYSISVSSTADVELAANNFTLTDLDDGTVSENGIFKTTKTNVMLKVAIKKGNAIKATPNFTLADLDSADLTVLKQGADWVLVLKNITDDVAITVQTETAPGDEWAVTVYDDADDMTAGTASTTMTVDDDDLALSTSLLSLSLTLTDTGFAAGDTYHVTAIYVGETELVEGPTADFHYDSATGAITFHKNAVMDGDMKIIAELVKRGDNRIVDVQMPNAGGRAALGDASLVVVSVSAGATVIKNGGPTDNTLGGVTGDGSGLYRFSVPYETDLVLQVLTAADAADLHVTADNVKPAVSESNTISITIPDATGEDQVVTVVGVETVATLDADATLTKADATGASPETSVDFTEGKQTPDAAIAAAVTLTTTDTGATGVTLTKGSEDAEIELWFCAAGDEEPTFAAASPASAIAADEAGTYIIRVTAENGDMLYYALTVVYAAPVVTEVQLTTADETHITLPTTNEGKITLTNGAGTFEVQVTEHYTPTGTANVTYAKGDQDGAADGKVVWTGTVADVTEETTELAVAATEDPKIEVGTEENITRPGDVYIDLAEDTTSFVITVKAAAFSNDENGSFTITIPAGYEITSATASGDKTWSMTNSELVWTVSGALDAQPQDDTTTVTIVVSPVTD